jgi:hypothetical protein
MIDNSSLPHSMADAKVARIRVPSESSLDELSTKDNPCARPAKSARSHKSENQIRKCILGVSRSKGCMDTVRVGSHDSLQGPLWNVGLNQIHPGRVVARALHDNRDRADPDVLN